MNQSPNELTAENPEEMNFAGFCDHCQEHLMLADADGLWLCEACDLDRLESLSEHISDADYPPVREKV